MKAQIQQLPSHHRHEFQQLLQVFASVFEWELFQMPGDEHLQKLLQNPSFLVFAAVTDGQLTGGLTAYVLERYDSEKPAVYLYDLAVLPAFQRKGIGTALVAALNEHCRSKGFSEVFVQAEADDLHAIQFYRSTPVSDELNAIHFTYTVDSSE
jgi:aminoglycoside 3-N-acetyltransferase I